jgi:hypothetical protein
MAIGQAVFFVVRYSLFVIRFSLPKWQANGFCHAPSFETNNKKPETNNEYPRTWGRQRYPLGGVLVVDCTSENNRAESLLAPSLVE